MHVISPSGTVHNFPVARHAAPEGGRIRLYGGPDKTEWVADIPLDWAVVAGGPKGHHPTPTEVARPEEFWEQQIDDARERRTTWLFGFIPLLITKKGLDR
jgi:hypothetical protein